MQNGSYVNFQILGANIKVQVIYFCNSVNLV